MIAVLFTVGLAGLLGMTWLFPLLGRCVCVWRGSRRTETAGNQQIRSIAILVPAHNEEAVIVETLRSIKRAVTALQRAHEEIECTTVIGADGCTDGTVELVKTEGINYREAATSLGKWRTIVNLVENTTSDWVVLADSGILWPEELLLRMVESATSSSVMGVAPSYRNPGGGQIETLLWKIEAHFKGLEASTGGPVTIHGATIMYRRRELQEALELLSKKSWLNDDVVLPLSLRSLNPEKVIRYLPELGVYDQPAATAKAAHKKGEFGRRRRMVLGNIEWIKESWWKKDQLIVVLALRRIFRLFWAYWSIVTGIAVLLLCAKLLMEIEPLLSTAFLVLVAVIALSVLSYSMVGSGSIARTLRSLIDSAFASLLAPWYLFTNLTFERAGWK